jgi:hypothetical protein
MRTQTEDIELNLEEDLKLTVEYLFDGHYSLNWDDVLSVTKDGKDASYLIKDLSKALNRDLRIDIMDELELDLSE